MDTSKIIISIICLAAAFLIGTMTGYYVSNTHVGVNAQVESNTQTPIVPADHLIFGINDNNATVTMAKNTTFSIKLDENPTTGYMWDISSSQGLTILESTFTANESGLIGAGGVHEWHFNAAREGMQGFRAVYCRPWMNLTGDEPVYKLNINVTG